MEILPNSRSSSALSAGNHGNESPEGSSAEAAGHPPRAQVGRRQSRAQVSRLGRGAPAADGRAERKGKEGRSRAGLPRGLRRAEARGRGLRAPVGLKKAPFSAGAHPVGPRPEGRRRHPLRSPGRALSREAACSHPVSVTRRGGLAFRGPRPPPAHPQVRPEGSRGGGAERWETGTPSPHRAGGGARTAAVGWPRGSADTGRGKRQPPSRGRRRPGSSPASPEHPEVGVTEGGVPGAHSASPTPARSQPGSLEACA